MFAARPFALCILCLLPCNCHSAHLRKGVLLPAISAILARILHPPLSAFVICDICGFSVDFDDFLLPVNPFAPVWH